MKITNEDLRWAASRGIVSPEQARELWDQLGQRLSSRPRFDAANVAYYLGALIVISAMGWFVTEAWERVGGLGLFAIAAAYAAAFVLAGRTLWDRNSLVTPGGLLFVMAVCMTPLAVYGLERATGWWPQGDPGSYRGYYEWIKGSWFPLEVATIIAGLVALRARRFPFLTAPIAFSLWFMSMDVAPLLYGRTTVTANEREWVSVGFGLVILLLAYLADLHVRAGEDFSFWGYLFGLMAFWGGLSVMNSDSELSRFIYFSINVGLIALSVVLRQRVFIVFGSLGVLGYLGHLSYTVFKDSLLFPVALSMLGICVIWLGVMYQRNAQKLERAIQDHLPASLRDLVPERARQWHHGTG
jgi:hypothetical protein